MKTKVLSVVVLVIVLALTAIFAVCGVGYYNQTTSKAPQTNCDVYRDGEVNPNVTISIDGKNIDLVYSHSEKYQSGKEALEYNDNAGNTYIFHESGTLTGYRHTTSNDPSDYCTTNTFEKDDEAIKEGEKYLSRFFGNVKIDEAYANYDEQFGVYNLTFRNYIGDSDFIHGAGYSMRLSGDGELCSVGAPEIADIAEFDTATLDGIKKEVIDEDVKGQIEEAFAEKAVGYTIRDYSLTTREGEYVIAVDVIVDLNLRDDVDVVQDEKIYYYKLG